MIKLDILSIIRIAVLVIVCFLLGCFSNNNKLKDHLIKLQDNYPTIPIYGWEVLNHEYHLNQSCYTLKRVNSDTVVFMTTCEILHDSIWNPDDDFYAIGSYRKSYPEGEYEHLVNGLLDTTYHIKFPINKPDSIIFITGKYYYQYRYGLLNRNQKTFYVNHSDSLDKLKGNNLPELPGR